MLSDKSGLNIRSQLSREELSQEGVHRTSVGNAVGPEIECHKCGGSFGSEPNGRHSFLEGE